MKTAIDCFFSTVDRASFVSIQNYRPSIELMYPERSRPGYISSVRIRAKTENNTKRVCLLDK